MRALVSVIAVNGNIQIPRIFINLKEARVCLALNLIASLHVPQTLKNLLTVRP